VLSVEAVFENLPATIRRSKVAIALREMSWTLGILTGSRSPSILHVGESLLLISTERDGYSAGASSMSLDSFQTRRGAQLGIRRVISTEHFVTACGETCSLIVTVAAAMAVAVVRAVVVGMATLTSIAIGQAISNQADGRRADQRGSGLDDLARTAIGIVSGGAGGHGWQEKHEKKAMEGFFHRLSDDPSRCLFKAMLQEQGAGLAASRRSDRSRDADALTSVLLRDLCGEIERLSVPPQRAQRDTEDEVQSLMAAPELRRDSREVMNR
jgi:hypothetical protein